MIHPIDNDLLSTKVFNALKEAMVDGTLVPGEKTTETKLADLLGVSRTPVREALKLLSAQGFVTLVKNSGVVINEFTLEDYKEQIQVRGALEGLAAALAAQRITDEQVELLRAAYKLIEDMKPVDGQYDCAEFLMADTGFHEAVIAIAGNRRIKNIENSLQDRMNRLYASVVSATQNEAVECCVLQHKEIMEAILSHDSEKAERLAREHTAFVTRYLEDLDHSALNERLRDLKGKL